jgi:hypothetical protein
LLNKPLGIRTPLRCALRWGAIRYAGRGFAELVVRAIGDFESEWKHPRYQENRDPPQDQIQRDTYF